MGAIQTAFAASQILGLPAGLYFSNHWGWHAPFLVIVALGLVVGVGMVLVMKPIDAHLSYKMDRSAFRHLYVTLMNGRHLWAFCTMAILSVGGFMLMPFASAFTTNNVGIAMTDLPIIYLATGLSTIVVAPIIGKLSDRIGVVRTFMGGSILSLITIPIYTNLGVTPLWIVVVINIVMFVGIFSRMIPSQTLMSAIPEPANRGAFMSLGSSLQQIAGGLASVVSGLIVLQDANGHILHYDTVGYILMATAVVSIFMIYRLNGMAAIAHSAGAKPLEVS